MSGPQILSTGQWIKNQAIVIEAGRIAAIIPAAMLKHHFPAQHIEFPSHYFLTPGLIDIHLHGANGHDVMDANEEAWHGISLALAKEGVTSFLATTMTAEPDKITNVLKFAAGLKKLPGAQCIGIHLEGPFIANAKRGAQRDVTVFPDIDLFEQLQLAAANQIKIVTLAPELPGAIPFIKMLKNNNVIASIGHTFATYEETEAAIQAGATQATHLFNAMRALHQREPGPVPALLLAKNIYAEIIVDGHHLHPAIVDLVYQLKQKNSLILVTDSMRAKCMPDGNYELGGQTVTLTNQRVTLADNTLAGSVLTLPEAIINMVKFTQCGFEDAIQMCTLNPASVLKWDHRIGIIDKGYDADLVVFDDQFGVAATMVKGKFVYQH
ncbi:MAG: N-acetylglucosamine-6-phosphate deacetylase [Gammaproteobacteria bacterium]|nr:N-acetylglucosamine-6-phosphate deacetylase [Gammaproteobacteria bacterium]